MQRETELFIIFSEIGFIQSFCINCFTSYSLYKIFTKDKNITFFFNITLLAYEELLKSALKIMQFLPSLLPKLNSRPLSNPMPYPEYLYLSMSALLFKLTAPNKQLSHVG